MVRSIARRAFIPTQHVLEEFGDMMLLTGRTISSALRPPDGASPLLAGRAHQLHVRPGQCPSATAGGQIPSTSSALGSALPLGAVQSSSVPPAVLWSLL